MPTCGYADRVSLSSLTVQLLYPDFNRKYGDLSTTTPNTAPLHKFRLDFARSSAINSAHRPTEIEFELSEHLDLGVSTRGVVGRQVTVCDENGIVLGVGIVGYN